eukprot:TRINITY_DN24515_c0_g1_i2.p1 TRINITY_DN24515_c0_g1~~TRINITY_DN24515_c0_g1_i2.p1  ORF type:complete len:227 (-),score=46.44 TRINITY_DN24515_c0_g1_i2:101-781(-)
MIRRPPRSTLSSSSAASDVYKRQYQRRVRGRVVLWTMRVSLGQIRTSVVAALQCSGLNHSSSKAVAEVVVSAERDHCHSHGLFRVPGYCECLLRGYYDTQATPTVRDTAPAALHVDAAGCFAPVAFLQAWPTLERKARTNGVAIASISNNRHFSALWYECEMIARSGLVAISMVNSRAFVHHWGGTSKVYGTNPVSYTHLRAHETPEHLVCRLLLEKKKKNNKDIK